MLAVKPEAITALQNALKEPDASVAEAARRALDVQLRPEPPIETDMLQIALSDPDIGWWLTCVVTLLLLSVLSCYVFVIL
jgi:hypothetical protein